MTAPDHSAAAAEKIQRAKPSFEPRVGLVLGSGLGDLADAIEDATTIGYGDLPGFPLPSVASHGGTLVLGTLAGVPVACLRGRAHYYEDGTPDVMKTPVRTLRRAGCDILLLTNAAGSLREEAGPGSLMLIIDHINFSGTHPLIGETGDERFIDMSEAYDPELRRRLLRVAEDRDITLHRGVYMWFSGPSFETPAEIRAARVLGADAIGMSTVPEVILARHAGLRVAAIANLTNFAAGLSDEALSHERIMAMAGEGGRKLARLIDAFLSELSEGG